jgi:hypothetical protein
VSYQRYWNEVDFLRGIGGEEGKKSSLVNPLDASGIEYPLESSLVSSRNSCTLSSKISTISCNVLSIGGVGSDSANCIIELSIHLIASSIFYLTLFSIV